MIPKEKVTCEEEDDNLELENVSIEPCAIISASTSLLNIPSLPTNNDLPRTFNKFTQFSGILYTLAASSTFVSAAFIIKQLGIDIFDAFLLRFTVQISLTLLFTFYKRYSILSGTSTQILLQVICCIGGSLGFFLFFSALCYTELSDVITLAYTKVVWTVLFNSIIYRERPSIASLLALPLTLVGVVLVAQPSFIFSSSLSSLILNNSKQRFLGLTLSIIFAIFSAVNVLITKRLISTTKTIKPSVLTLHSCIGVFTCLIIYQLYKKFVLNTGLTFEHVTSWRYIAASVLSVFIIFANIFAQKGIKREHPAVFTLLGSTEIVFSLFLQNVFTTKRSNLLALLGSLFVISSVVILGISKLIIERRTYRKINSLIDQSVMDDFEEKK